MDSMPLKLLRVRQWYKNLILFAGIVFSSNLSSIDLYPLVLVGFLAYSFSTSGSYILNDVRDRERDLLHPLKKDRVVASGAISTRSAMMVACGLWAVSLTVAFLLEVTFGLVLLASVILSTLYTFRLKDVLFVDLLTISVLFVLRAVAGCVLIGVFISPWLILCAFLLAMFLVLCKRKGELLTLGGDEEEHRPLLALYTGPLLDTMVTITTATLVMSYCMYTFLSRPDDPWLMLTLPFVFYGIFRYLFLIDRNEHGGVETEMIFRDRPMVLNLLCWISVVAFILYDDRLLNILPTP